MPLTLGLFLLALSAFAQSGQTPPENAEEPVIKAGTEEVMLDVVVRDKHGRRVTNLQPEDLEIFDNGLQRKVQSFRLVVATQPPVHSGTALPTRLTPAEKPKDLNPLQQIRLVTLIFNRLDLNGRQLAHAAAADLLRNEFPENVYMSVFVLGDSLQALQPFTNDRALLRKAVDHATSGAYTEFASDSKRIEEQMTQMLGPATAGESIAEQVEGTPDISGGTGRQKPAGESATPAMARIMLNMLQTTQRSELAQLGRSAIWGLISAVEGQTRLPGRKSILFFSSGFGVPQGMEEPWKTLISTANRFNVTFYSIDARGLGTTRANEEAVDELKDASSASRANAQMSAGTVSPSMANGIDTAINAGKTGGQDTLADLAQSTGGFLIANSNDFREGLRKVSEDIESYYEITYNPGITSYDGSYRKIEVRSARAGLRIQSRAGYFALPVSAGAGNGLIVTPYEVPLLRALNAASLPHAFDFQSAGLHFRGPRDEPSCSVVVDVPLANVSLRQANAQSPYQGDLAYVAIVKDTNGEVVEKFRGDVPLASTATQMAALKNSHFIFTRAVALPAGRYTLEAAVMDRTDDWISARKSGFLVPASEAKIGISSVAVVRNLAETRSVGDPNETTPSDNPFDVGGKVITPSLSPVTKGDAQDLRFFMVIYPDKDNAEKPELVMTFRRDGIPVGNGSPVLPEPDAGGRIPYIASASPDKMEPGNYEVQFFVMQGSETARETVTFTLN